MRPRDIAERMRGQRDRQQIDDGFKRETFTLPRDEARRAAREFLNRYPKEAYSSAVECWRLMPDDHIEFTMRRLPTAD